MVMVTRSPCAMARPLWGSAREPVGMPRAEKALTMVEGASQAMASPS